jgi:PAS domain S-box-containing protein
MNPTAQPETQSPGKWGRLAWLPIPLLLAAILAARLAGLRESYESHTLLLVLSFTFYTLVSLGTLYLIGRSFMALGSPGLLLLECGVVFWSLAGTVGDFVSHGDANINVTIFNIGILLAGLCHLAGAILALRPQRALRSKPVWLGAGCAFALGALWLVSQAALSGWLPVFFISGLGGTMVRYCVLISAIVMFVLSAGLLLTSQRAAPPRFTSWYAFALLLLAVGLFGVMIQLSLGSVVNWLGRTAQWLAGLYLLLAAVAALRESNLPLLPPEKESPRERYRYGVAIAIVLASAAVRLVFLQALEMRATFVTFYPAVMLAALYGGLRTGLLATALAAVLAGYLWIPSNSHFVFTYPADWLSLVIFLLSGLMIAWVSESMHRARTRASVAETQALLAAEREAAAEVLRKSEERYHTLFTAMTEGFAIHELLTDEPGKPVDYRFLDINPAFERLTGLKRQDVVGKTLNEVLPGDDPKWLQMYSQVALTGQPVQFENYAPVLKRHYEVFAYRPAPMQFAVIFMDITERKRAEDALQQRTFELQRLTETLEQRVRARTEELEKANETLQELSSRILSAQEGERKRIAGELHDTIGSCLSGVKYKIENVLQQIAKDLTVTEESLSGIIPVIQEGIEECRRMQQDLRPSLLDDLGLLPTLSWYCRRYQTIYTGIKVELEQALEESDVPNALKIVIFRVTQEGMNNIAKHSKGDLVRLSLRKMNGRIELVLADNGQGFDLRKVLGSENTKRGLGLTSMRERTELSGGSFAIESVEEKGTTIHVSWPLRQDG